MGFFDFLAPVAQTISNAVNAVVQPIAQIVHPIIQSVVSPVIATVKPLVESTIQIAQQPITPPIYRPLLGQSVPLTLQEVAGLATAGVAAAAAAPAIVAAVGSSGAAATVSSTLVSLGAKEAAINVVKQLAVHVVAIPSAIEIGGLIAGVPLPQITPLALGLATTGALGFGVAGKIGAALGIVGLLSAVVINKVPTIQTKVQTVKQTVSDLPSEISNELKDLQTEVQTLTKQQAEAAKNVVKNFTVQDLQDYIAQHKELFVGAGGGAALTALLSQQQDIAKALTEAKDILIKKINAERIPKRTIRKRTTRRTTKRRRGRKR